MSEEVKKVSATLKDFISLAEEHDDGSTPGLINVGKMSPEIQETIHKNFHEAMQDISDIFRGKKS